MTDSVFPDLFLLWTDSPRNDDDDNSLWFQVQRGTATERIKFRRAVWHRCQSMLGAPMPDLLAKPGYRQHYDDINHPVYQLIRKVMQHPNGIPLFGEDLEDPDDDCIFLLPLQTCAEWAVEHDLVARFEAYLEHPTPFPAFDLDQPLHAGFEK